MKISNYKRLAGPVVALAVLAGCATATPYQPLGYPGGERGGYASQQLDQTHFRVSFVGNTLTSRQQVENYLLYRAAELTLQQGYSCFTIVNRDTDAWTQVRVSPFGGYGGYGAYGASYYPGWTPYWRLRGPWGWYNYDPWMGDPFFPGRYDVDTVTSYQAMADIALGRNCTAGPGTFAAQQVIQNLQPYIIRPRVR